MTAVRPATHNQSVLTYLHLLLVQSWIKCKCKKAIALQTTTTWCDVSDFLQNVDESASVNLVLNSANGNNQIKFVMCTCTNTHCFQHMLHLWFNLVIFKSITSLIVGERTSTIPQGLGLSCLTIQMEVKCRNCMDVISGLDCNESSLLPFELEHQWSSGQPQLSEQQRGCQSPQSHILGRQAAQ